MTAKNKSSSGSSVSNNNGKNSMNRNSNANGNSKMNGKRESEQAEIRRTNVKNLENLKKETRRAGRLT
tara:strand:+ start:292 stop:495 length:204 start_codon:yes stop_codon:yes gene_type:complete